MNDEQVGSEAQVMVGSAEPSENNRPVGRSFGDKVLSFAIGFSFLSVIFWVGWFLGYTQPKSNEIIYISPTPISDRYTITEPIDIQVINQAIDKGWLKVE